MYAEKGRGESIPEHTRSDIYSVAGTRKTRHPPGAYIPAGKKINNKTNYGYGCFTCFKMLKGVSAMLSMCLSWEPDYLGNSGF